MPRIERIDIGNNIYHVINRANARVGIFGDNSDYLQFESILEEAVEKFKMRLLAYCIMSNHWHLVLYPLNDGDLKKFMSWLTNTHTRRWHASKKTIGTGHLYQGRYKSFICQTDAHFLALVRYVERNAMRANLVERAEDWRWSSAWVRSKGTEKHNKFLSDWIVPVPRDYLDYLNEPQNINEIEKIRRSIIKNIPFGNEVWQGICIKKFGLEQTLRGVGRPRVTQ